MSQDLEWVLLREFISSGEAEVAKSLLESCQIPTKMFGMHESQIMPHLSSAVSLRLMVQRKDVAAAQGLLQQEIKGPKLDDEHYSAEKMVGRASRAAIYGGLILPVVMQFFSFYLLLQAAKAKEILPAGQKVKVVVTIVINIVFLVWWGFVFFKITK